MAAGDVTNPEYITRRNADALQVSYLQIQRVGEVTPGPDMIVPDGFNLVVLSAPTNTALNWINIGGTKNAGLAVIPLGPGQSVSLGIRNPKALYLSGTSAGDTVIFYTEINLKNPGLTLE